MKIRHLAYAVLMVVVLSAPALGWTISAGYTSWDNYWNGYQWVTPGAYYGYYPYYTGYYYPTVYTPSTYPDIVYPTYHTYETSVINVQQSQPYVETSYTVYQQQPVNYNYQATATSTTCGDGWCSSTESQASCPADCAPDPYCGDHICNNGETSASCPYDCGAVTTAVTVTRYCGDGACNNAETQYSCPQDCGLPDYCGDGSCNGAETKQNCPEDCGLAPYCGDGVCNNAETKYNCAQDCGLPPYCGDGSCNGVETEYSCSLDCGEPSCTNPSGDPGDETCEGRELLFCDNGFWEFERSVQCCSDSDCAPGYECSDNYYCEVEHTYVPCVSCVTPQPYCGDGSCNDGETCSTCSCDCGSCAPVYYCGDHSCNSGETCATCPGDCGICYYCGDGVCNTQTETQINCPQDCGQPAQHAIDLTATDECFEVEQGESQTFTIYAANNGNIVETLTLSVSGEAASWASQPYSVVVAAGASESWTLTVNVPAGAEPGLYNLTATAQNAYVQDSVVLHIDVKLPPMVGAVETVPVGSGGETPEGGEGETSPTGAPVSGTLAIPDWVIVLGMLLVLGVLLILLIGKTTATRVTKTVITTDGGKPVYSLRSPVCDPQYKTQDTRQKTVLPVWATKRR